MEAMVTTMPWLVARREGRNSRSRRKCESRLRDRVSWVLESVPERMVCPVAVPALLTRIVGAPWVLRMLWAVSCTAVGEVMSQG